ncbi:hypothetical protein [Sorangium sp. So ce542]|uniref:hypothetical protein n=1 Tax=Sorangium sp. So ce542 TaxID=3133316 RepID=UPI003F64292C
MARHVDTMAARLPLLYRDGELVRGLLAAPGVQLEIFDEDAAEVRRAHLFDQCLELDEAARLAAVLDLAPEPWQGLREFRAWVHAIRNAMLGEGAVTVRAMRRLVAELVSGLDLATEAEIVPRIAEEDFASAPSVTRPALVETPARVQVARVPPAAGGLAPLGRFELENRGLDDARASFLLVGAGPTGEFVPVVVNTTTGQALLYLGPLPPGARLWIRAAADGTATAQLEQEDVTAKLCSVSGVVEGAPWEPSAVTRPARAIDLARGKNDLWFLPLAHLDERGLDRFLLALPGLVMEQGRFDQTAYDQALFAQDPALWMMASWREAQPARFEVTIPAGALVAPAGASEAAIEARARLEIAIDQAVARLRAAGVTSAVRLLPHVETQRQADFLRIVPTVRIVETGPTGGERLRESEGAFDVTKHDDSTFV